MKNPQPRPSCARAALGLGIMAALAALAGCAGMTSSDMLANDLFEMRQQLAEYHKNLESLDNRMTYSLTQIDQNLAGEERAILNTLNDLERMVRDQQIQLDRMNRDIQAVGVMLDRIAQRTGVGIDQGAEETEPDRRRAAAGAAAQAYNAGQQHFHMGDYDRARESFTEALDLDPDEELRIDVLFWLGESSLRLDDLEAAQEYYRQLVTANPRHPKAWISLERVAMIYHRQGNHDDALVYLRYIADEYEQHPDVLQFIEINRVRSAIADIEREHGPGPSDAAPAQDEGAPPLPMQ